MKNHLKTTRPKYFREGRLRKLILTTAAFVVASGTAHAQMPYPKNPYSATLEVTQDGVTTPALMFISGPKLRMNMTMPNGPEAGKKAIFVADRKTGEAFSLVEMDGRKVAIKMNVDQTMDKIGFSVQELGSKLGTKRIGSKSCTNYKTPTGTTCLTKDNIVLEAYDDGRHMLVTKIKMGHQSPSLFQIPAGYQLMDLGGMMGGLGSMGNLGTMGGNSDLSKMLQLGKALANEQNQNDEGLGQIMQQFGLPSGNNGGGSFANILQGQIKNQVQDQGQGIGTENLLNRGAIQQQRQMLNDAENGIDPLEKIIQQEGISGQDLSKLRKAMALTKSSAAGNVVADDQLAIDLEPQYAPIKAETATLEDITKRMEAAFESGQMTEAKAAEFAREIEALEKRTLGALGGN